MVTKFCQVLHPKIYKRLKQDAEESKDTLQGVIRKASLEWLKNHPKERRDARRELREERQRKWEQSK